MFELLFKKLESGDKVGFDLAFPGCYEKLRYIAQGLLRDREAAKDAANEVLEKILKLSSEQRLSEIRDPDGWVVTVTRNHCLSSLRVESNRARLRKEHLEPFATELVDGEVTSPLIIQDVYECLKLSMTNRESSIWQLLTVNYMDRPEICDELNISDSRLRAYIAEIKKKVLKCVENE